MVDCDSNCIMSMNPHGHSRLHIERHIEGNSMVKPMCLRMSLCGQRNPDTIGDTTTWCNGFINAIGIR